ncbi:hypothetical protein O181_059328 [Austropuccinia psidii MF-1]|uniref:Uncharacterized protein n=1 Tax=Austropuccinia psidii MF-1 TaxID=1389203 RepID=A0A9Q3EIK8_9BASI|nr:hypothetical protein [Austropuccinia psidii MF-1]
MPIQHSPPARKTRSQARAQAVITPTPTAPLEGTPEVPQLRAKKIKFFFRSNGEEEEVNSVEEEGSDGTEGIPAPVGESQHNGGPTIAQSNTPFSHQFEPYLLAIMQKMTQIIANLQAASSFEASRLHV